MRSLLPFWSLTVLLLVQPATMAQPTYHRNYGSITEADNSTVIGLYQSLADNAANSLSHSLAGRVEQANSTIGFYRIFISNLSIFRSDLESRGMDSVISSQVFSTAPFSLLGESCLDLIASQAEAVDRIESLQRAEEKPRIWVEVAEVEQRLERLGSVIGDLNSRIDSLPPFIDRTKLGRRADEVAGALSSYYSILDEGKRRALQGETEMAVELIAAPDSITSGEIVRFSGRLSSKNGVPVGGREIEVAFLGLSRAAVTGPQGTFSLIWRTENETPSGVYPAIAIFEPEPGLNISVTKSNVVQVSVSGTERMRTFLDIQSDEREGRSGRNLTISGRLHDEWGRGLVGRSLWIRSPNLTIQIPAETNLRGIYSTQVRLPESEGEARFRAFYEGNLHEMASHSDPLSINVTEKGAGPFETLLAIAVSDSVTAGGTLSVSGRLKIAQNGTPLQFRNVSVLWQGEPSWIVVTDRQGEYGLEARIEPDAAGVHEVRAIYVSENPNVESCNSSTRTVLVNPQGQAIGRLVIAVAAISLLALGLAIARSVKPRSLGMKPKTTGSREVTRPEPGRSLEASPEPKAPEESAAHRAAMSRGRREVVNLFVDSVGLISRALSMDLSGKTHREIAELVRSKGFASRVDEAVQRIAGIYEKGVFSGQEIGKDELSEIIGCVSILTDGLEEVGS